MYLKTGVLAAACILSFNVLPVISGGKSIPDVWGGSLCDKSEIGLSTCMPDGMHSVLCVTDPKFQDPAKGGYWKVDQNCAYSWKGCQQTDYGKVKGCKKLKFRRDELEDGDGDGDEDEQLKFKFKREEEDDDEEEEREEKPKPAKKKKKRAVVSTKKDI